MQRITATVLLCVLIFGCQSQQKASYKNNDTSDEIHCTITGSSDAERWMTLRQNVCKSSVEDQRSRLKFLSDGNISRSHNERFERLIIASCHPDMTPGILRESIADILQNEHLSESEKSLIQLVGDFEISIRVLEEKNRKLKDEMEKTIEGIRSIETEIGDFENSGEPK